MSSLRVRRREGKDGIHHRRQADMTQVKTWLWTPQRSSGSEPACPANAAETQCHQKQTNKVKNTYLKKDLPPLPADLANAFWLAGRSVLTIPLLALPAPRSKVSWRHAGGWRAAHAPPGLQEDVNSNMQTLGARAAVSERGGALTPRAEEVATSWEFGAPAGG